MRKTYFLIGSLFFITQAFTELLDTPQAIEVLQSNQADESKKIINKVDEAIKIGKEMLDSAHKLPLFYRTKKNEQEAVALSSFPKETSDLINNLDPQTVNEVYNKLKELPEGKVSEKVQEFLSKPELQDPKKLAETLKNMKIEPLESLTYSVEVANVTQIAKETLNTNMPMKEPLKILTYAASGKIKEAAEARVNYTSTIRKLVSPEGVSNMFGDAVVDKIVDKNGITARVLDENHISAISYELSQKGYSRSDIDKICGYLDDKMNIAMTKVHEDKFEEAANAMLEYEGTLKQLQLNEIYNIEQIDPNVVEKFAKSLAKEEIHPTHKRVLDTEHDLMQHGITENLISGNVGQTLLKSQNLLTANADRTKLALADALAARLNITKPEDKQALLKKIESSSSYNMLIKYTSQSFQNSIKNAIQSHHEGDSKAAAKYAAAAAYHLSITKDPKELERVTNDILGDIVSGKFSSLAEEEKKTAPQSKNKTSSITSLAALQYVPPPDKPIIIREIPNDVREKREMLKQAQKEMYEMHHNFIHTSNIAAKHNTKAWYNKQDSIRN